MKRIADYELVDRIGQGNHGVFFKARTPERLGVADEFCAVKVLDRRATDDEFRRMANELQLFASARSPHLVQLFDAGHERSRLYYAVRFHPQGSLARPAAPLEPGGVVRAVADAARGAHALHEVGVAHRDIKPANVLLTDDGAVLADLGLASTLQPGATVTGTGPIGSIAFMEPGVVRGERAGRASDIWSLGVTLHHALTGRGVHDGLPDTDVLAALRHVLDHAPVIGDDVATGVADAIRWCLAPARADRPATAEALAERLDALAGEVA